MLDVDEKRAFALLAEKMIEADGIVVGREAAVLASLKAEMGLSEAGDDDRSVQDLARVFKDRRSRVAAFLELLGVAHADTDFDLAERTMLVSVAKGMGLEKDEVAELEGWVQDHVALVRRAMVFMRD